MDSSHHHHHQQQQQQQQQQDQSSWLAFSLSNHQQHMPSDSSHLCLFDPFNSNPSGIVHRSEEEHASGAADLSVFSGAGSPKLEDFLGGGCGGNSGGGGPANVCHQFSVATPAQSLSNAEIYDSELKSIAASFLRGFASTETENLNNQSTVAPPFEPVAKKHVDTLGQRTSIYRGVTRHRWTGRYEAHLWDNSCRREGQSRKGRQVYLGGYDKEERAARAYDLAALKYWGPATTTNFVVSNYEKEMEEMKNLTRQEFVASLRRRSSGFSRGASIYRGVTRHHQHGRWQARIGRVAGNKDLYLGTFSTQEEAAEAYDIAAIKFRGLNAVTNFDMSRYDIKSIASGNLPIGGMATNKSKTTSSSSESASDNKSFDHSDDVQVISPVTFSFPTKRETSSDFWSMIGYQSIPPPSSSSSLSNAKDPKGTTLQASGTTSSTVNGLRMDFNGTSNPMISSAGGAFLNGDFFQQQSNSSTITLNSNNANSSYEVSGGSRSTFGNCIVPSSLHSFQPAKPNLCVFQTPIFGME